MRRRSGSNFEQIVAREFNALHKNDQNELANYFKKTQQRNGGISFYDLVNILRSCGYPISEERKNRLNKELAIKEIKTLDLPVLMWAATVLKKQKEETGGHHESENNQYLDAFVALGGGSDKMGYVSKNTLISTIKNQFELTFDIETLVEGLQGAEQDRLDYTQFCALFQHEKKNFDRKGSSLSLLSQKTLQNSDSMKSLVVDEKDFDKYIAKMEGHQVNSP